MKKKKEKETTTQQVDKLRVGDQVFYYGYKLVSIEEVVEVKVEEKLALLSNNSWVHRYPNSDGSFNRVNVTGSVLPEFSELKILRATPKLIHLKDAIYAKNKIMDYLWMLEAKVKKFPENDTWDRWSKNLQDKLITICGHLAKAMEESPLTDEEIENLQQVLKEKQMEQLKEQEQKLNSKRKRK